MCHCQHAARGVPRYVPSSCPSPARRSTRSRGFTAPFVSGPDTRGSMFVSQNTSTANHTILLVKPGSHHGPGLAGSLARGLTGSHLEAPVPSPAPDPRPGHRYSIPLAYLASGPPPPASPSATETPLHRSPPLSLPPIPYPFPTPYPMLIKQPHLLLWRFRCIVFVHFDSQRSHFI